MNEIEQNLYNEVLSDQKNVVKVRRYLHMHPELSAKEYETQKFIESELDKLNLPHKRIAKTGVYTKINGTGEGKTIVLRADIDALPITEVRDIPYKSQNEGVMHACGHDAQSASLLRALSILVKHTDLFPGTIIATFQPGEEIGYGARIIVDEGDIDGADRTFGIHMASDLPAGSIGIRNGANNASVDQFKILVHGHGCHIAQPHRGADAAFAACSIAVQSQTIIPRRINPIESALIGIGHVQAGTTYNVVAGEALLEGTVRAFNQQVREQILKELEQLARNTAEQYGCTAEFINKDNTSPLINDEEAWKEAVDTAVSLFGRQHVITNRPLSMSGDDMAEYIKKVSGVYVYAGSRNESRPETCVNHHDDHFDIDEDALRVAEAMYTIYPVDYLNRRCGE